MIGGSRGRVAEAGAEAGAGTGRVRAGDAEVGPLGGEAAGAAVVAPCGVRDPAAGRAGWDGEAVLGLAPGGGGSGWMR